MSVVVQGMDMPDSCRHCCMMTGTFCDVLNIDVDPYYDGAKHRNVCCPLVELPEKHGRLIDADHLMEILADRLVKVSERYGVYSTVAGAVSGAMGLVDAQNVIIEAEDET